MEAFREFLQVDSEPKLQWLADEMMHAELPEGAGQFCIGAELSARDPWNEELVQLSKTRGMRRNEELVPVDVGRILFF